MRILVVEDNDEISEALNVFCGSRKDIDCHLVNNGKKGLESIRNEKFDLILLDLAMPDFSGLDVIESLKQDGFIESKNIVIFTASSDQTMLKAIRDIGVREIFKKPFSLDDLIKLIERYRPRM